VQITFAFIFVVVALLILFASVWLALVFASQLVRPVGLLADAAERVRSGDLTVRVAEGPPGDEVGTLSRAFNRMTSQLQSQRRELIEPMPSSISAGASPSSCSPASRPA
jgi:Signal transduction histidine kinase involved in nitrogen fixation and metabolism regulation